MSYAASSPALYERHAASADGGLSESNSQSKGPILQRLYTLQGEEIHLTMEDILAWRDGQVRPEIQRLQRYVFPKLRGLVTEFNDAAARQQVAAAHERRRYNGIKTLIDENIRPDVVLPILWDVLGPACSVSTLSMKGKPDSEVFNQAMRHGFDTIVTKDKAMECEDTDLTGIALRHFRDTRHRGRRTRNNFPLIVQFDLRNRGNDLMPGLLSRYYKKVGQAVIDRRTPFVRLSPHNGYEMAHEIVHIEQLRPSATLEVAL